MRAGAGFPDGGDFVGHARVLASEEGSAVDHHVDLVGALGARHADIVEPDRQRGGAAGECRGYGGDLDRRAANAGFRGADQAGINADRGAAGSAVARRKRRNGFAAEIGDFSRRVFSLERGEVHHRENNFEALALCARLDAALAERRGALIGHYTVDCAGDRGFCARSHSLTRSRRNWHHMKNMPRQE